MKMKACTEAIMLYSKEKDLLLLKDLRKALRRKGLNDDKRWNDFIERNSDVDIPDALIVGINRTYYFDIGETPSLFQTIPVSRDDFQTMFLLY